MSCLQSSRVYGSKLNFPCSRDNKFYAGKICCPSEAKAFDLAEKQWVEFPYTIQTLSGPGGSAVTLTLPTPLDSTEGATAKYHISGKVMHLSFTYRFTTAAPSSGVGAYFISLPSGYTYNDHIQDAVGSVFGLSNSGARYTGTVTTDFKGSDKRLVIYINDASNPVSVWGSGSIGNIALDSQSISFNASVEIV